MKRLFNIVMIMSLFGLGMQAKIKDKGMPVKKDIVFDVVMDSGIIQRPYLIIYERGNSDFDNANSDQKRIESISRIGNTYRFELKNQVKPLYFSLMLEDKFIVERYHFEPGDRIRVLVKKTNIPNTYDLAFSGHGSAKYRCKNEFKSAVRLSEIYEYSGNEDNRNQVEHQLKSINLIRKLIEKYQPELSDYSFHLLNAEAVASFGLYAISELELKAMGLIKENDTLGLKELSTDLSRFDLVDFTKDIPDVILRDANKYSEFMVNKFVCENLIHSGSIDYQNVFQEIEALKNIPLRDKMIMEFMVKYSRKINSGYEKILTNAIFLVKDPYYLSRLKDFKHNISGLKAYNFSLQDVNGKIIRMDDFKGKVVFVDFWFTGCSNCGVYYKTTLAEVEEIYKDNPNIVFITVSIDKQKEKWLKSVKSGEYTSARAINLYTNGEGLDNGVIQYYNINVYPSPMLISHKGEIIKFTGNELRKKQILIDEIKMALKKIN